MEMDETSTLAVVVARLDDMKKSQEQYEARMMNELQGLRAELRQSHEDKVSRGEWLQRNTTVDNKFDSYGKELSNHREETARQIANLKTDFATDISELKQENAAKKSPPAVWISLAVSAAVAMWAFFNTLASLGADSSGADGIEPGDRAISIERSWVP